MSNGERERRVRTAICADKEGTGTSREVKGDLIEGRRVERRVSVGKSGNGEDGGWKADLHAGPRIPTAHAFLPASSRSFQMRIDPLLPRQSQCISCPEPTPCNCASNQQCFQISRSVYSLLLPLITLTSFTPGVAASVVNLYVSITTLHPVHPRVSARAPWQVVSSAPWFSLQF